MRGVRRPIPRWLAWSLAAGSVLLLCGAYLVLAYRQPPNSTLIPGPKGLWKALERSFTPQGYRREIWFLGDVLATFGRLLIGLLIGFGLSLVAGIAMAVSRPVEAMLAAPVSFLARVPATAMLAIFFVLVGTDLTMFVAIIAVGVLPTLTQSVYAAAVEDVPEELVNKGLTLGAGYFEIIWDVIFRTILPRVIEAARLQVGPALVFLIAAEMLVADQGFGYRLRLHQKKLDMSVVYVYVVLLGVIGLGVDFAFRSARRLLCPWYAR